MIRKRRTYLPRILGDKVMMPADLKRLHKYMLDIEHIGIISDEIHHPWLATNSEGFCTINSNWSLMAATRSRTPLSQVRKMLHFR